MGEMTVCALVPAYNEEKTISEVIRILKETDLIDSVVLVNDGSTDNTARLAEEAGARVYNLPCNRGKGAALQKGLEEIDAGIIMMLDADLIGLKEIHLKILLEPLFNDQADMTIGVFNEGRGITDLAQLVSPNISGQRAVKREMLSGISMAEAGFGVEVAINNYVKKHGRLKYVDLPELTHLMKEEKMGLARGVAARAKMYWEIVKVIINQ